MTNRTQTRLLPFHAVFLCIVLSLTACSKQYSQEAIDIIFHGTSPAVPLPKSHNKEDINTTGNRDDDLIGSIAGNWDEVTGWISFPYDDGSGEVSVLVRGLEGIKQTGDAYSFSGWDGDVFWINMGDGVPRLLPAKLKDSAFVPQAADTFTQPGKLYEAGYVLYRQKGVDYPVNEWADEAVLGDLLFVTDANDQVLEIVVDVYNDNGVFIERRTLAAGDQLQMLTHAYNLNEPDVIYLLEYMEYKQLSGQPSIEKARYQPNVDFTDTDLLARAGAQFDTSALKLELLVDAARLNAQDDVEFAFNTPQALGYTWGEAKQAFSTNTTSGGGGAFDWILLLLAGLGSARLIRHQKKKFANPSLRKTTKT